MKARCLLPAIAAVAVALLTQPVHAKDKDKDRQETEQVRQVEQQWIDAYVKADTATLEKIEADDFVLNDPSGAVKTKADDIRDIKSGDMKFTQLKLDDSVIRVYGKVAIVTGLASVKGTYKGQPMDGSYRFTDVLVRKGNEWKGVSSQITPVMAKK